MEVHGYRVNPEGSEYGERRVPGGQEPPSSGAGGPHGSHGGRSLVATCRLHAIDGCTYFVAVVQCVAEDAVSRVAELTPRACEGATSPQTRCTDLCASASHRPNAA